MHHPVRRPRDAVHREAGHPGLQALGQRGRQGGVVLGPDEQGGDGDLQHGVGQGDGGGGRVALAGRAQRRGAVVVAAAGEAGAPGGAVLLLHRGREPAGAVGRAGGAGRGLGAHGGEELPEPAEIVLGQQRLGIGADQEVHVRAGRLLLRVAVQLAQKGARVRRVDDRQLPQPRRVLVGEAPGHRAAPVVGHQRGQRTAGAGFGIYQGGDVLHQVLGAVGGHLGGRAGGAEAAHPRRHAAVAAVRRIGEVRQQRVPDEGALGEAVQKQQHRPARRTGGAAGQGDAVGQGVGAGVDHGHLRCCYGKRSEMPARRNGCGSERGQKLSRRAQRAGGASPAAAARAAGQGARLLSRRRAALPEDRPALRGGLPRSIRNRPAGAPSARGAGPPRPRPASSVPRTAAPRRRRR